MSGLGAMMTGGNPADGRQEDDFYPTPIEVPIALMLAETFVGGIHECACGNGAMSEIFKRFSNNVVSTDLVDRGYGTQMDFLASTELMADNIITNPPFDISVDFINHALSLQPESLALILKSTYWGSKRRRALFERTKPYCVYQLTWRPDFLGKKRPTMDVMWCVWRKGHTGETAYRLLKKPTPEQVASVSPRLI